MNELKNKKKIITDLERLIEEAQSLKDFAEVTLELIEGADTEEKMIDAVNYFCENEEKLKIIDFF